MAWEKFEYAKQDTILPARILLIDELASFLDNRDRSEMRLVDRFNDYIQNITRLGRAAHIHYIGATQSASSSIFPPTLKNNIQFRNICGRVDANISRMAIDSDIGESISKEVGSYMAWTSGDTLMYKGYYTNRKTALSLGTHKPGYILTEDESGEATLALPETDEDEDETTDTTEPPTDDQSTDPSDPTGSTTEPITDPIPSNQLEQEINAILFDENEPIDPSMADVMDKMSSFLRQHDNESGNKDTNASVPVTQPTSASSQSSSTPSKRKISLTASSAPSSSSTEQPSTEPSAQSFSSSPIKKRIDPKVIGGVKKRPQRKTTISYIE